MHVHLRDVCATALNVSVDKLRLCCWCSEEETAWEIRLSIHADIFLIVKQKIVKMSEPEKMDVDLSIVKEETNEMTYEEKLQFVSVIAKPMAPKKLAKKIFKCIKKASKHKTYLRNGLKDVQKYLRKGETGLVVFAGDVYPIEIMCHLPIVCEDKHIPYCFIPSRLDLGAAMGVKRGSLMVLIKEHPSYKELYDEIKASMMTLPSPL